MAHFFLSLLTTATAGALIKNKLIKPKKTKLVRPISTPEIYQFRIVFSGMGNAKATKLYRDRQNGKVDPLLPCPQCGKQVRTNNHGGLCSRCWYKTDEGKENCRQRTRKCRQKKKNC